MTEIKIENGKVFINGVESTNPELIGLAILDLAEELLEIIKYCTLNEIRSNDKNIFNKTKSK